MVNSAVLWLINYQARDTLDFVLNRQQQQQGILPIPGLLHRGLHGDRALPHFPAPPGDGAQPGRGGRRIFKLVLLLSRGGGAHGTRPGHSGADHAHAEGGEKTHAFPQVGMKNMLILFSGRYGQIRLHGPAAGGGLSGETFAGFARFEFEKVF